MNVKKYLKFIPAIGEKKPNDLIKKTTVSCPFCNLKNEEDILDKKGSIKWVRNLFQVFENAYLTVLIEDDCCNTDFSNYTEEHAIQILSYGINKWNLMKQNKEFKSVIFYKNHGPYSGGSLHHSHMQLVGLKDIDYLDNLNKDNFQGILIHEEDGVVLNISTMPIVGNIEFNIIMKNKNNIKSLSEYIQIMTSYILNTLNTKFKSYNLFFYEIDGDIIVKITSRTVTSPYMIGYQIPQTTVNLEEIANKVRSIFNKKE